MTLDVLFDFQIFYLQEYGGISRYVCELARNLAALPETGIHIDAGRHHNAYLQELDGSLVTGRRVPRPRSKAALVAGWLGNAAEFRGRAARGAQSHIHLTYFYELVRPRSRAARILTVYDMTHELFPSQLPGAVRTAAMKRRAVGKADHVICISDSTRLDLIRLLGVRPEKVTAIHLGLAPRLATAARAPSRNDARPFLLYVGQRGGYKNFAGFLAAYAASARLRELFDVVCFGGGPLSAGEREAANALGVAPERLRQVSGSDDDLAAAYRSAAMLVYPSRYEGFGFPPLEAMAVGCPVACSNTSSIPEVVGDAAVTFDPDSVEAMAHAMTALADDSALRARCRETGFARAQMFTWQRCATQTRAVYAMTQ
jgi:glycosyltransferase involved in cell wall biosynthesis